MLRASARQFVLDRYPPERVAALADGSGFDRSEWRALAEMGWTGISVPETGGGAGLSFFEEMILAEELGRGLYPGPFFGSVVLALPLLRDRKSTRLNSSHVAISYAVFCLKKKNNTHSVHLIVQKKNTHSR